MTELTIINQLPDPDADIYSHVEYYEDGSQHMISIWYGGGTFAPFMPYVMILVVPDAANHRPGYVFEYGGLMLEIVGYDIYRTCWIVKQVQS